MSRVGSLLYASEIPINDHLSVKIPTIGKIKEAEDDYFSLVCSFVATPYDLMVQLDDAGIDFTKINDFELFMLLLPQIAEMDASPLFGELKWADFAPAQSEQNGELILLNGQTGAVIDASIHERMCSAIRKIHYMEKEIHKPANEEARKYLIERARKKLKRRKNKEKESPLDPYIIALVNTPHFKYDYEQAKGLTVYQFYSSVYQIAHKIRYDNMMIGAFAGTIKMDEMKEEDKTWVMTHK